MTNHLPDLTKKVALTEMANRIAAAQSDHIDESTKKLPTIIDRICEALEARRICGDKSQHSDAIIYNDLLDNCIADVRRVAASGATEGEIDAAGDVVKKAYESMRYMTYLTYRDIAETAINAMLGRE